MNGQTANNDDSKHAKAALPPMRMEFTAIAVKNKKPVIMALPCNMICPNPKEKAFKG
ncbi:hypothetical protein GCM10019997_02390 [Prevotella corporis]